MVNELKLEDIYKAARVLGYPCIIPAVKIMKADIVPADLYANIRRDANYSFLLESAEIGEKIARYSFLGYDPLKIIKLKDKSLFINGAEKKFKGNPLTPLRELLSDYNVYMDKLPKFFGGLLGYFSYDIVRYFEDMGSTSPDELKQNDAEFMFVKDLIVFDHWRDEILLISTLFLEEEKEVFKEYEKAQKIIKEMEGLVKSTTKIQPRSKREKKVEIKSNFKKEEFEEVVLKAKEYIFSGDIFQVVLSQRFECKAKSEPFEVYQKLKEINPSPYMYFLEFDNLKIVGSSPEILVRVDDGKAVVRPIAGTRPRGKDVVEDEALGREMVNDPKERAEHVMLVDLGRNDIGKITDFGTVEVDEFMAIEKYSHVQHIVSNVVGRMGDKKDAFDAFEATFPAGTVSGAPKVRAMEIIEELEKCRRGIYAGTVGYFSFDLNMDLAITIRTIVFQDGRAYVQAGAGIVADSVPENEHRECQNKGKAMIRAIELAGG
ncbi:MAG: anthranilate synthase component I [Candidatus Hydrothermarchaeales archaeon]